ncbi:MAG: RHS repeat-associated core domain-containing protein [Candidatus Vecturithrix sp.]|nr:RHS repeat-associated core domain-containing protein [Candidatus Vecturithrix sp.]
MKGQPGYVTDASGSAKWWYDARYRVSKEQKTIGAKSAATEFQYNAYQLTGVKYPGESGWTSYTFDAAQEITQLTAPGQAIVDAVLYNPFGQMTQIDFSSGASQAYSYYPANEGDQGNFRLKNITINGASGTLMNRSYTYDKTGNILGIHDTNTAYDQSFEYDALGRLVAQTNHNFVSGAESFSYSLTGNLLSNNGRSYTYKSGTHQAISDGLNSYSYDPNGNMASKNDLTFRYDADNRLISLSSGERFEYDFSGRRVQKTDNNATTSYFNAYYEEQVPAPTGPFSYLLWTGSGAPPEPDPPAETGVVTTYYYLNGLRVAQKRDGAWTWIHADHLHSATVITDENGTEVRRLAYRAFGEEALNTGTGDTPPYTYTGKELDRTGLYYYGARYYDPVLARFISPDTVYDRGPQGLNRYSYALNNPILYFDPMGYAVKTPQYMADTSYELLPYIKTTFDTGSDLADIALASLSGVYNVAAVAVNAPLNAYGAAEQSYNWGTEQIIGQQGLSGQGLTEDLLVLQGFGLPVGSIIKQVRQSSAYTNTWLRANASRLHNWYKASTLADETGSLTLGKTASNVSNNVMPPKDIRYMQSSAKNVTGEYTVLSNVDALKASTLKPTDLPAIRVWKDAQGKVWTLDHRRLIAFKMAGVKEIPVKWVSKDVVSKEMWKMTTQTDGLSIKLKLGGGKSIIVE